MKHLLKERKARQTGIEINGVELNEVEKLITDPNRDKIANEVLNDMEKTLTLVKDINYETMKEFIYRSNLI